MQRLEPASDDPDRLLSRLRRKHRGKSACVVRLQIEPALQRANGLTGFGETARLNPSQLPFELFDRPPVSVSRPNLAAHVYGVLHHLPSRILLGITPCTDLENTFELVECTAQEDLQIVRSVEPDVCVCRHQVARTTVVPLQHKRLELAAELPLRFKL